MIKFKMNWINLNIDLCIYRMSMISIYDPIKTTKSLQNFSLKYVTVSSNMYMYLATTSLINHSVIRSRTLFILDLGFILINHSTALHLNDYRERRRSLSSRLVKLFLRTRKPDKNFIESRIDTSCERCPIRLRYRWRRKTVLRDPLLFLCCSCLRRQILLKENLIKKWHRYKLYWSTCREELNVVYYDLSANLMLYTLIIS